MYKVAKLNKKIEVLPVIWIRKNPKLECFWPVFGITFKIKNLVKPPLEIEVHRRKEWKIYECILLLDGKSFDTYEGAQAAMQKIQVDCNLPNNLAETNVIDKIFIADVENCEGEDTDYMVQCDLCNRWSHYSCVGVGQEIEELPWSCQTCLKFMVKKKTVQDKRREIEEKKVALLAREMAINEKEKELLIRKNTIVSDKGKGAASLKVDMEKEFMEKEKALEDKRREIEEKEVTLLAREMAIDEKEKELLVMKNAIVSYKEVGAASWDVEEALSGPKLQLPVNENNFETFNNSLKVQSEYDELKKRYDDINIKNERTYIKACIELTFSPELINRISFRTGKVSFYGTLSLNCLIAAIHTKFKNKYDDTQARNEIKLSFQRIRNLNCKRK